MKKVIYSLLVCLLIGGTACKQESGLDVKKLDAYLDLIGKNNQDMGELIIRKKGQTLYHKAFNPEGISDVSPGDALKYRIGSISKMYAAVIAFRMQEEGVLSIEETIRGYFPTVPNADKITISHLLTHTSGLKNIVVKNDSIMDWLFQPVTREEIIEEIIRQGTLFEPGEDTFYSNSGYYLLTSILEQKSGRTFPELVEEKILTPLKLSNTVAAKEDGPGIALPYKYNYRSKQWEDTPDFYFPNIPGVGDMAATPDDMAKFIDALFAGELVSVISLEEMKPVTGKSPFGKGIAFVPFYDKVFYGHSGGTFGAYAMLMHNEEDGISVALVINGQEMGLNDLLIDVLKIVYGMEMELPTSFFQPGDFDPENYSLLEGVYGSEDFPLKLTVFRQGDDLYMQGTNQPSFPVNQIEELTFIKKDIALEAVFLPEEGKMEFTQFGRKWVLTKE